MGRDLRWSFSEIGWKEGWRHLVIREVMFCSGFSSAQINLLPTIGLLVVDRGLEAS